MTISTMPKIPGYSQGVCKNANEQQPLPPDVCRIRYFMRCRVGVCGTVLNRAGWELLDKAGQVLWASEPRACDGGAVPEEGDPAWREMEVPAGAAILRTSGSACNGSCANNFTSDALLHFEIISCCDINGA